jgi:hypothetical protein
MSIQEVLFFSDRLAASQMPRGAFVVNRFRIPPAFADAPPTPADAADAIAVRGLALEEGASVRVVQAHADAVQLAALDARHVSALGAGVSGEVPVVRVAELASDVHDLTRLGEIAEQLMRGGV